jgi:hypothetical protein
MVPADALPAGGNCFVAAGIPATMRSERHRPTVTQPHPIANADALLRAVAATEPGAGAVRCWPHHFDIATLLDEGTVGGVRHTMGIGLSPGDAYYPEPYFYVGPHPYPRIDALPALGAGHWRRAGWVGAALPGAEVVAAGDAAAQARLVSGFVTDAVAAARTVRSAAPEAPAT